jgi:uncharacterized RmlC-like cupin family protein
MGTIKTRCQCRNCRKKVSIAEEKSGQTRQCGVSTDRAIRSSLAAHALMINPQAQNSK